MIEAGLLDVLDGLRKRVLKDNDVGELVKQVADLLQSSVKALSTFEKWAQEVQRGRLCPGGTHTERFWKDNAKKLEENLFAKLRQLVALLECTQDPVTVQLALQDLGEFARFHPYGRAMVDKLNGKAKALELLQSQDPRINQAALLCVQKCMISHWQQLGAS